MAKVDLNLPSNSNASKTQEAINKEAEELKSVAKGRMVKKHQFLKKTLEVFSGKNIEASADDVIENVIVPALWDLLREAGIALWNKILDKSEYTSTPVSNNKRNTVNNGNYVAYGSASRIRKNVSRKGDYLDPVYFDDRAEAERVRQQMVDVIENRNSHVLTVEDFCAFAGIRGDNNYLNERWGWNDITGLRIRHTIDGEYYMQLPKVLPVEKNEKGEYVIINE